MNDFLRRAAVVADGTLAQLGVDARRLVPMIGRDRMAVSFSGLGITMSEYASLLLLCALFSGLAFAAAYSVLMVLFGLRFEYLALSIPVSVAGALAVRYFVHHSASQREREVERGLLDALRHLLSELKGGADIGSALSNVAQEDYGPVSEAIREMLVLMREGASPEEAVREASGRVPGEAFARFASSLSFSLGSGHGMQGVLERYIAELELSQRSALSLFTNESAKLSTVAVVVTGVLPGLLVFALAEGAFVFGLRPPVEGFMTLYLMALPAVKLAVSARLGTLSPGV